MGGGATFTTPHPLPLGVLLATLTLRVLGNCSPSQHAILSEIAVL